MSNELHKLHQLLRLAGGALMKLPKGSVFDQRILECIRFYVCTCVRLSFVRVYGFTTGCTVLRLVVRLYACTVVRFYDWLYGCTVVRLYGCTVVRFYGCKVVRLYGCVRVVSLYGCTFHPPIL
jgi:hypothetical protein